MPSKKSVTATHSCKICHHRIEKNSIFNAVFTAKSICLRCFLKLKPTYFHWKENGIRFFAIYPYEQFFQTLLYQYKGCGDIELGPCFMERINIIFRLRFHGYRIVYAPSHPNKVLERGFDHVPLMFEGLKLPILHVFAKTEDVKQSSQSKGERRKVGKYIRVIDKEGIRGQKILFVDDVFTTGSTARACVKALLKLQPKRLCVLILAKVPKRPEKHARHPHYAKIRA